MKLSYTLLMSSFSLLISILVMGCGAASPTADHGPRSSNIIYTDIATAEDLQKIGTETTHPLDGNYRLITDITLANEWTPIGSDTSPFTGRLDGQGYDIRDLDIDMAGDDYVGLFAQLGKTAAISNLYIVVDEGIRGKDYVGALAGLSYANISRVRISGELVRGISNVGGLVGSQSGGSIHNSYAIGKVAGTSNVGGVVGEQVAGAINSSYATGNVEATAGTTGDNFGGLVGVQSGGSIRNSYYDASTTGQGQGVGDGSQYGVTAYYTSKKKVMTATTGGKEITTSNFPNWDFTNIWNWQGDGRWPDFQWKEPNYTPDNDTPGTGGKTGTDNPDIIYTEIATAEDLQKIGTEATHPLDGNYRLTTDITLANEWTPIGSDTSPFTGHLDGKGHTIRDLHIDMATDDYVGLFAQIGNSGPLPTFATITGLSIVVKDEGIRGKDYVGVLAGASYANISEVQVSGGTVTGNGDYVGGLVGQQAGSIKSSYATGMVTGAGSQIGGLVGRQAGSIESSYATGMVTGAGSQIGGLVGEQVSGAIYSSYATGSIEATAGTTGDNFGGLVGKSSGTVATSYATGMVTGRGEKVGGLVGSHDSLSIIDSYATGAVVGSSQVGGLVGLQDLSLITNSYATGMVTGPGANVGGLVGLRTDPPPPPEGPQRTGVITNSYYDTGSTGQTSGVGSGSPADTPGVVASYTTVGDKVMTAETGGDPIIQASFDDWNFISTPPVWTMTEGQWPQLYWQTQQRP